ncbi:MAG: class I SAM-dependent methyltransferase [Parcubacteria group bacterium]
MLYYSSFFRAMLVEANQRLVRRRETRKILELIDNGEKKILEIGSNLGYLTGLIANGGAAVTGIDTNTSVSVFKFARWRNAGRKVVFDRVDALEMPFPDNSFDYVVLSHVLEHFSDPMPLLNEIKRVLKKEGKGRLITVVPIEKYLGQNTPDHKLLFRSIIDLKDLLRKNGFYLVEGVDMGKAVVTEHSIFV